MTWSYSQGALAGTVLEIDVTVPLTMRKQGVLSQIVKKGVEKFNPTTIKGTWKANYNGAPSTNYVKYQENIAAGMSPEAAALATPTGRAATNSGFGGTPKVTPTEGQINVEFTPTPTSTNVGG